MKTYGGGEGIEMGGKKKRESMEGPRTGSRCDWLSWQDCADRLAKEAIASYGLHVHVEIHVDVYESRTDVCVV